jgi:hypothetical protein
MNALERIADIRQVLSNCIAESVNSPDLEVSEICEILYAFRELKRDIGMLDSELEQAAIGKMEEDIIVLSSGQQVERRTGADRKAWDHKGLASIVANRIYESSIDMDTGEVLLSPMEMMAKMLDYAAPSYWRVGELGKIGVSADSYCEKSEGKVSISITSKK